MKNFIRHIKLEENLGFNKIARENALAFLFAYFIVILQYKYFIKQNLYGRFENTHVHPYTK